MTAGKYCVRYSTQAKKDLKAIFSYIAYSLEARQTADRQAGRIRDAVRALDFLPERHPVVDWEPWHSRMIRRLSVNNYVVYYRVESEQSIVKIMRIVYGGRDIKNITVAEEAQFIASRASAPRSRALYSAAALLYNLTK